MKKRIILLITAFVVLVSGFWLEKTEVRAEGEVFHYGSEAYTWALGQESPIGLYVESDDPIYYAEVTVNYDSEMLTYNSGASTASEGTLTVGLGGGRATEVSTMLYFTPVMSGMTEITVTGARVEYESGETVDIPGTSVDITIPLEAGCSLTSLTVNGESVADFKPEVTQYSVETGSDIEQAEIQATAEEPGTTVEISDTALNPGMNTVYVTTTNGSGSRARYVLYINRPEETAQTAVNPNAETDAAGEPQESQAQVIMQRDEGSGGRMQLYVAIFGVVMFIFLVILIVFLFRLKKKQKNAARRARKGRRRSRPVKEYNADDNVEIDVQHVTMEFRREKDESTSIKELLIRILKREVSYETFKALDDVSFTVHKGEVVGIIGTNGSGKSTILKIISGALSPTKGRVIVDKDKIQLLTLGTGFDFELTGRENVYLNGALIGYTKEFIDEKYDDIVKFAELEGFMEEKVRNYSSGMVSRLGFAIATIGSTPEILILDEVLSVGDMFFRQKSEARIREMMHSGSTVLIVSHSTSVILKNCTKAVWIERGKLRAVGEPKEVCAAYEKMGQTGE